MGLVLPRRLAFLARPGGAVDLGRGLRTFLAMALPYGAGLAWGAPSWGLSAGFFAQMILLADVGGLYWIRGITLLSAWGAAALALGAAYFAQDHLGLMLGSVGLGLFGAGYLTVFGEPGAMVGLVLGFSLLLGLAGETGGLQTLFAVAIGGAWALLLALLIWPFLPNQPLRQGVAQIFQSLSRYLRTLAQSDLNQEPPQMEAPLAQLRQNLLEARRLVALTRRGGWGQSQLRELLIVLIEDSERLLKSFLLLQEILHFHDLPQLRTAEILMSDLLESLAELAADLAQMTLGKTLNPDLGRALRLIQALEQQEDLQRRVSTDTLEDYNSRVAIGQLTQTLTALQSQLEETLATARLLAKPHHFTGAAPTPAPLEPASAWQEPLSANFSLASPLFRHGLRLGLGGVAGTWIAHAFAIPFGYWISLTLIFVLKPDFSLTFQRLCNRLLGTLFGAAAVSWALKTVTDPVILTVLGIVSISVALALLRFHYSLAVFFITAFALIVQEIAPHPLADQALGARILCTLIGAGLAFLLSFGFLRHPEDLRFAEAAQTALTAVRDYFQLLAPSLSAQKPLPLEALEQARTRSRLASTAMQAALDRLLNDPSADPETQEPAVTIANYIPRLGRGLTVLVSHLEQSSGAPAPAPLIQFQSQTCQTLANLGAALETQTAPAPLTDLETALENLQTYHQTQQRRRLEELSQKQERTATQIYLKNYNLVIAECQQIYQRLSTLQAAIRRFWQNGA
ncbi:MAG: FUSC family protein [Cyanobacteria bacterium RI_101]|nr:FUSC family protein [Cyanobacteria bacterium RI_101]